jgi:hypothetical protein
MPLNISHEERVMRRHEIGEWGKVLGEDGGKKERAWQ